MNALPCPACGFDVRPDLERMKRMAIRRSANSETHWRVVSVECAACDQFLAFDPGLSPEGVGPETIVPAEVEA